MSKSGGVKKYSEGNKELPEFNDEMNDGLAILAHIIAHHHIKNVLKEKTSETMQVKNSNA